MEVSRPGRFTPEGRARGTRWIGGWMGPRAGLDDMEKRKKISCSCQECNPDFQPVAFALMTELSRLYLKRGENEIDRYEYIYIYIYILTIFVRG
jgi:hypothetical protein